MHSVGVSRLWRAPRAVRLPGMESPSVFSALMRRVNALTAESH
jgi:hypothetical protein